MPGVARSRATSTGVLRPGEMLYLPPYWLHLVLSLDSGGGGGGGGGNTSLSLAVNVWTGSTAHEAFSRMQVCFPSSPHPTQTCTAARRSNRGAATRTCSSDHRSDVVWASVVHVATSTDFANPVRVKYV